MTLLPFSVQAFLPVVLIISLLTPSLLPHTTFALNEGGNSGGLESEGSDTKAEEEAAAKAEAEAEAAAQAVNEAASLAAGLEGRSFTASSVGGANFDPGNPTVNITTDSGQTISGITVGQAQEAIGSIAAASDRGINSNPAPGRPGVDVAATFEAAKQGKAGVVVGNLSGVIGTPSEVAKAEIDARQGQEAVSWATGAFNSFVNTAGSYVAKTDLGNALVEAANILSKNPQAAYPSLMSPNWTGPTLGTTPAPGSYTSFTPGSTNPNNANITLVNSVVLTGDLSRAPTTVTYNGQTATTRSATFADFVALDRAGISITNADRTTLGQLLAGELPSKTVQDIVAGRPLSDEQMREIGMILSSVVSRYGSDRGGAWRSGLDSLAEAARAGNTRGNAGQYSAFNANSIGRTENNYNRGPSAFNALVDSYFNGAMAKDRGLAVAVPTVNGLPATHYSQTSIVNQDTGWRAGLQNANNFDSGHRAGTLAGEFTSITGGTRDATAGLNAQGNFQTIMSLDGRGLVSSVTGTGITPATAAFAISGSGNVITSSNNPASPNTTTGFVGLTADEVEAFANSFPEPQASSLGGLTFGNFYEVPAQIYDQPIAITPGLEAAFRDVGILDRNVMETVISQIDLSNAGSFITQASPTDTSRRDIVVDIPAGTAVASLQDTAAFWSDQTRNPHGARLFDAAGNPLVDPKNLAAAMMAIQEWEKMNPQYRIEIYGPASGLRTTGSLANHGAQKGVPWGAALDWAIVDRKTGQHLTNHPDSKHAGQMTAGQAAVAYQSFYNEVVVAAYALGGREAAESMRFGGYFTGSGTYKGKDNALDSMHIDTKGAAAAAGGTILGGFTERMMTEFGIPENNGLGSWANIASQAAERYGNSEARTTVVSVTPQDLAAIDAYNRAADTINQTAPPDQSSGPSNGDTRTDTPSSPTGSNGSESTNQGSSVPSEDSTNSDGGSSLFCGAINFLSFGLISCPPEASAMNPGAMIMTANISSAATNIKTPGLLRTMYEWFVGKRTVHEQFIELPDLKSIQELEKRPYATIVIQIDEVNSAIRMVSSLAQNSYDGIGESEDPESNEVFASILFSSDGSILYSNGIYAPIYENGRVIDTGVDYVYFIERYQNGELMSTELNARGLPGNLFTRGLQRLFGNTSPFTILDVDTITYVWIDPDTNTPHDEYKQYTITLLDGSQRTVNLPVSTSLEFYTKELSRIGYQGDPFSLTELGIETSRRVIEKEPNILSRTATAIHSVFSSQPEAPTDPYANLANAVPDSSRNAVVTNIRTLKVYLNIPTECPDMGTSFGYVFEISADINLQNGTPSTFSGWAPRCGDGGPMTYATSIAEYLRSEFGLQNLSEEQLLERIEFVYNTPEYQIALEDAEPATSTPTTGDKLPNLTNTITFEVKAVGTGGTVLADWSQAEKITIGSGVQLYFRWNGSDYSQCLPFLNDNGNYSLTVRNRAMTTGNTETEGYNINERSGVYRLECGGQRNNEFGVDSREIEVVVD